MKKILGAFLAVALTLSTPVTAFAKTENNNLTNTKPTTITDVTNLSDLKIGETVKVPLKVKDSIITTINGYAYNLNTPCVSIYAKVFWMN